MGEMCKFCPRAGDRATSPGLGAHGCAAPVKRTPPQRAICAGVCVCVSSEMAPVPYAQRGARAMRSFNRPTAPTPPHPSTGTLVIVPRHGGSPGKPAARPAPAPPIPPPSFQHPRYPLLHLPSLHTRTNCAVHVNDLVLPPFVFLRRDHSGGLQASRPILRPLHWFQPRTQRVGRRLALCAPRHDGSGRTLPKDAARALEARAGGSNSLIVSPQT